METEKKTAKPEELSKEKKEYLSSFKEAMRSIDVKIAEDYKNRKLKPPKAYARLVRDGYWRPDIIGLQFALVSHGMCPLPKALRDYIEQVGLLAKEIFDKSRSLKAERAAKAAATRARKKAEAAAAEKKAETETKA